MEAVFSPSAGDSGLATLLSEGLGLYGQIRNTGDRALAGKQAAREAEARADRALESSEEQARMVRERNRREHDSLLGEQRRRRSSRLTRWGRSGVRMSGSPLLAAVGSAVEDEKAGSGLLGKGRLEEESVLASGRRAADEYLARALEIRRAADRDAVSGYLSAAGSLLSKGSGGYGRG